MIPKKSRFPGGWVRVWPCSGNNLPYDLKPMTDMDRRIIFLYKYVKIVAVAYFFILWRASEMKVCSRLQYDEKHHILTGPLKIGLQPTNESHLPISFFYMLCPKNHFNEEN